MASRSRRTRSSTRKGGKRLFSRIYSPLHHLLQATRDASDSVFRRSGRVVKEGIGAVDNIGTSVMRHANMTVKNIVGKGRKNTRKNRKNRKH